MAAIGLAGENRVFMATIEHTHASAARGVGVIMGDKRLKAIAVRGTKDLNDRPAGGTVRRVPAHVPEDGRERGMRGLDGARGRRSLHLNHFAWGNARTRRKGYWSKEREKRMEIRPRATGGRAATTARRNAASDPRPGRPPFFQKCYSKLTYHMAAYEELDFNYDILGVTQEYGSTDSPTPQVLAFALELYEAGILTDEDLPGFPATGSGRFFYLVEKIVRREGIGDALANGVYHAARRIGKGAEAFDHNTTKKFEQVPIKLGMLNPVLPHDRHRREDEHHPDRRLLPAGADCRPRSSGKKFVNKWEAVPTRSSRSISWSGRSAPISDEATCNIVDWNEAMHYIDDAIGTCAFLSSFRGQFGRRRSRIT